MLLLKNEKMNFKKLTLNELRQTKDSYYENINEQKNKNACDTKLRIEAENFLHENFFNLKLDLKKSLFNDVVTALVEFNKIKSI